jgi:hypothetical protein
MVKAGYFVELALPAAAVHLLFAATSIRAMWRVWRDYFCDAGRLSGVR